MKKNYGLIGYPVKHSLSAKMHNAAFKHLGIDAEYRLFEVKPHELDDFFSSFKERLWGINITIPHKETSIKHMDELREEAGLIGAINTVVRQENRLIGYNTDVIGFTKSLKEDLNFNSAGKKALILGAGGASRAVSFGLFREKIQKVILADIDNEKAVSLAGDLRDRGCDALAVEYNKKVIGELALNSDLLVNATPCGMKEDDPEIFNLNFLHKNLAVFDLIYNPQETHLIKQAKANGAKTANGLGMLLRQGIASFYLWTEREIPIEVMKKALNN